MVERTPTRSATHRPAEAQVLTGQLADRRLETVGEEPVSPGISTAPADLVEDLEVIGAPRRTRSSSGAFPDARARRRYRLMLALLIVLAAGFAAGLLAIDNPMPVGARGCWLIAEMLGPALGAVAVPALRQAGATPPVMAVTTDRLITPSIMGFESLYAVSQPAAVYAFAVAGLVASWGTSQFLRHVAAMVGGSVLIYG